MPSGKTHDRITLLIAVPTFVAAWSVTKNFWMAAVVTGATLFGGLMFGPDLDIQSRQYTRWGVFRFLWWPYQVVFRHRSRWSHGILFGTLIRVVYFTGMLALIALAALYLRAALVSDATLPSLTEVARAVRAIDAGLSNSAAGRYAVIAGLIGLWWGAASHTLTDVAWSMLRKGSELF